MGINAVYSGFDHQLHSLFYFGVAFVIIGIAPVIEIPSKVNLYNILMIIGIVFIVSGSVFFNKRAKEE